MKHPGGHRIEPWLLVLVPVYAVALQLSLDRWTDPLVDFGRQLYVPWRILEGELLYRDIAHVFGPLAAHVNALVFAVLGVSMQSLVVFNLVLVGAFSLLLHLAFRAWFGRAAGVLAPLLYLLVFAFPQYIFQANYNFVTPYSYDLSYGLMLAMLSLHLVLGGERPDEVSASRLFGGGVAAGAVLLTKPELVFALAFALPVACMRIRGSARMGRTGPAALVAGASVLPAMAYLHFARELAPLKAVQAVFGALLPLASGRMGGSPFYAWVSGLDSPARNGLLMLALALPWLLAAWIGARVRIGTWSVTRRVRVLTAMLVVAVAVAGVQVLGQVWIVHNAARALPLLVAGVILWLWLQRDSPTGAARFRARIAIAVFALLMLAKMPLNAHLFHYGFALAMPASCVIGAALVSDWNLRPQRLLILRALLGSLALGVVLAHLYSSIAHYSLRNTALELGSDTIRSFDPARDPRSAYAAAFVQWGRTALSPADTLLVLPDAAMLNFALRRSAGVPYYALPRPELDHFGEDVVLQAYRRQPPDYIAIVDQRPAFFGAFGAPGYGERIMQWVNIDYVPVARFSHDPRGTAGLVVLARRTASRQATTDAADGPRSLRPAATDLQVFLHER